jgi:hypothetical protein
MLAEGGLDELEVRIKAIMEEAGYRCEMRKRLPAGRPEWHCCAMSFSSARLRI